MPEVGTFAAAIEEALDDQVEQAELIYCTAHRRVVDVVVSREDS